MVAIMEITAKAFWSYAHADNVREHERILNLAKLVREEYETLTGTTIKIFTDRDKIGWGDDFRAKIDEALQETAFFIPILTPTYFVREECRKEMSQFVRSASALGLEQLLLSLRYIPVADMTEHSADELKSVAAKMQFEPWESLRLEDEDSSEHRKAVHNLAARLVELAMNLESKSPSPKSSGALGVAAEAPTSDNGDIKSPEVHSGTAVETYPQADLPLGTQEAGIQYPLIDDDAPGLIDLAEDAQPAMESWTETLNQLTATTESFNGKFSAATEQMNQENSQTTSFARKILISRELALEVEPELQRIEELSKSYSAGLLRIDVTLRALFGLAELSSDSTSSDEVESFRSSIAGLVQQSTSAMEGLESAADAARKNAKLSRDLRPVLRRFETAMRNIIDGSSIIREWESL